MYLCEITFALIWNELILQTPFQKAIINYTAGFALISRFQISNFFCALKSYKIIGNSGFRIIHFLASSYVLKCFFTEPY